VDPDPHQSDKLDPDLHQSDKLDPDPNLFADDKPKRTGNEPIWALFQGFEPLFVEARIRIRNCIKLSN
jgi:hypothetical protein